MLLLEQVLVLGARLDDRRHVDVVERRQQRSRVLRFLETVGDRLAQARHLHALFVAFARLGPRYGLGRGCGRSARLRRRRSASFRLMDRPALLGLRRRKHVVLGQPAILAGSADLAGVDMVLEHRTADCGRKGHDMVFAFSGRRFGSMLGSAQLRILARSGGVRRRIGGFLRRGCRRRRFFRGSCACSRGRIIVDARNDSADGNRVAFVDQSLAQNSGRRRRNIDADLVRLERRDGLVRCDRLTGLFQPLCKRAFGDRFTKRGNCNVSGHGGPSTARRRPGPRRGCYDQVPLQSSSPARRHGAWRGRLRAKPRTRGPHRPAACP